MGTQELHNSVIIMGDPLTLINPNPFISTTGELNSDLQHMERLIVPANGTLTITSDITLAHYSGIKVLGKLILSPGSTLRLNDHSSIQIMGDGEFILGDNSHLITSHNSVLISIGTVDCHSGVHINVFNMAKIVISGKFIAQGSSENRISIYQGITFTNMDSLTIDYTDFYAAIEFLNTEKTGVLNLNHTNFFSGCEVHFFKTINLFEDSFIAMATGLIIKDVGRIFIQNCTFGNSQNGIIYRDNSAGLTAQDSLTIISTQFDNISENGLFISDADKSFIGVNVDSSVFNECGTAIILNNFTQSTPGINNNIISDYRLAGIQLMNGNSVLIENNSINTDDTQAQNPTGINLTQVSNPYLLNNHISTSIENPGSGIVSVSSNGNYRLNEITGYYYGIELGNSSSPNMAQNEIHNNKNYGIYISAGSNPKLNKGVSGGLAYPISGYNNIYENGTGGALLDDPEIFVNKADIQLSKGCNTIADDRYNPPNYNHTILIDGARIQSSILADSNYWGDHPLYGHNPAQRFGNGVSVRYTPYNTTPCTYSPSGENMLLMTTTTGSIADTLYTDGALAGELSPVEMAYSNANHSFYSGDYTEAENNYKQIIAGSEDSSYSLEAYNGIYLLKKYQNANAQGYESLKDYYAAKLSAIEDTSILIAVHNLMDMCDVSKKDYEQAISSFEETVQNNQGTDIALYNEINAYTTALLVDSTGGLGKSNMKYRSQDITEYLHNINDLLKTRGKNIEVENDKLVPTRYFLYQNYPNPFNPVTTIKYAIPKAVDVELKVFDILGREIKTLVNDTKKPGYYEVQFNAGYFASGVYFYRLKAGEYVKTGKMLLLK